jgi:hypothetical protein
MSVIATIRIPEPKIRKRTAPARRIFADRKKQAARSACRGKRNELQ